MIGHVLKKVSKNLLRGQPVPAAMGAIWEAQLTGLSPIIAIEYGEVELVSEYVDDFFLSYRADFCGGIAARAYERMFRQIAFIGREAEGSLIGYWLRGEGATIEEAPIVILDNDGRFDCSATTFQDHFVRAPGDDRDATSSIRRWFHRRGIDTRRSREAVWESLKGLPDPNDLYQRYQMEELARSREADTVRMTMSPASTQ
jgi:hypothetical protein